MKEYTVVVMWNDFSNTTDFDDLESAIEHAVNCSVSCDDCYIIDKDGNFVDYIDGDN